MSVTVQHISDFFDQWAPFSTQADYDNSGLLTGSKKQSVTGILTCLDVTDEVIDEALSRSCNLIVAHHPIIFGKLSRITSDTPLGALLYRLIQANIAVLAVHTNLDAARNGVSFILGERLGVQEPVILQHHDESGTVGYGVFGSLRTPLSRPDFLNTVCAVLGSPAIRYSDTSSASANPIRRIAVCGGSGVSLASEARKAGADAYVTADIKYHDYFEPGLLLVDAGHYETEAPIIDHLRQALSNHFSGTPVFSTTMITNPMQVHLRTDV